ALIGNNRPDEAQALMNELGETGLADFLLLHRALMAEASGNSALALQLAGNAYDNEPYVARLAEVYARMLANSGDFDAAKDVLDAYGAQGASHPLVDVVRASIDAGKRPGVFT